jgi:4-amino-4-deoxy-L-arabinose transferase-like glycosyltransferase
LELCNVQKGGIPRMKKQPRLPFSWLGRYTTWVGVGGIMAVAAFLRFFQLSTLPPGLAPSEARLGLEALKLADHGWLPGLTDANNYAPLWVWLQAISIKLAGPTEVALRLWPALFGLAAVYLTWLWAKDWFGPRIGWLAAFFMAVTPWAITLSRDAGPAALIMFLTPLMLWSAGWAYRRPSFKRITLAVASLLMCLLSGPVAWLVASGVLVAGAVQMTRGGRLKNLSRLQLMGGGGVVAALAVLGISLGLSWHQVSSLPHTIGFIHDLAGLGDSFSRVLLMFNMHGDENFRHNFAGQPMLNAFVGLMFVAGVLASATRWAAVRYRAVLIFGLVFLLPAIISSAGAPNSARAIAALPLVMTLAAIGASYMLELWYTTFPVNSAARGTGQSVMVVLLLLTLLQGYTQYFRAWAVSAETYTAFSEPGVQAAAYLRSHTFSGQRTLIATEDELTVANYLTHGQVSYTETQPSQLDNLPVTPGSHLFVITATARDDAAKTLSLKYPGGKLRPQLSTFSQNEIYYTYEITK